MVQKTPELLTKNYQWLKNHSASSENAELTLQIIAKDRTGLIHDVSKHLHKSQIHISYTQSWNDHSSNAHLLFQITSNVDTELLIKELKSIKSVSQVSVQPSYANTYGKRVIILGGGAQVAQAASGAITEADRHNIRGERISVDTIAVVGEQAIADAVRAVGRLHRAGILILAGALMGGDICNAVTELRTQHGIPVIALKMAGSINQYADLTVTDPLEAGVMAVMAISHVAKFDILRLKDKTI